MIDYFKRWIGKDSKEVTAPCFKQELKRITEDIQGVPSLCRDTYLVHAEYEAGLITTPLWNWVLENMPCKIFQAGESISFVAEIL
jgi:hypothetical protein